MKGMLRGWFFGARSSVAFDLRETTQLAGCSGRACQGFLLELASNLPCLFVALRVAICSVSPSPEWFANLKRHLAANSHTTTNQGSTGRAQHLCLVLLVSDAQFSSIIGTYSSENRFPGWSETRTSTRTCSRWPWKNLGWFTISAT